MEVLKMSTVFRPYRKGTDQEIVRLNSVGLSLSRIAKVLGCHPTTVTLRLKSLGVEPADTRRSFMEDIFTTLPEDHQEWLADQLEIHNVSIKDYVKALLVLNYQKQGNQQ